MKTLTLLLFAATFAIIHADESADKAELAEYAAGDADTLSELLADNWEVRATGNEITLTSKFEVFLMMISTKNCQIGSSFKCTHPRRFRKWAAPRRFLGCFSTSI
jgi:hypothetical protein